MSLCILCAGAVQAEVIFNPALHAFPTRAEDGSWSQDAPMPFIPGEMGDGLLEIWFGRVSVCDCFIVRCNGEVMMIDGGKVANSPYSKLLLEKLDEYFTLLEDELPREFERWPDGVGDPQRCRAELENYITANRQRQCAASLLTHLHLKEDALPPGFPALDTLE